MLWFLEKDAELMACEVRKAPDGSYVYEVTGPEGDIRVQRFDQPTPLLNGYLQEQQELRKNGWRPRRVKN